jgi:hypothetical protein
MPVITKLSELDLTKLKIKKPYDFGIEKKSIFNFSYDGSDLWIQSPVGIVPYKPSVYQDEYGHIDMIFNNSAKSFMNGLNELEAHASHRIRSKKPYENLMDGKCSVPCCQEGKIRFTSTSINDVQLFNSTRQLIGSAKDIKRDCEISVIFQVVGFQILGGKHNRYGLYLRIIQAQIHASIPETDNDDAQKYLRMVKMGIPLLAIQQKMAMDGVNVGTMKQLLPTSRLPPPPPPPRPPPPPPPLMLKSAAAASFKSKDPSEFLNDIKNGNFKLRQATSTTAATKAILRSVDTSRKVPSLNEIVAARKNLRPINNND